MTPKPGGRPPNIRQEVLNVLVAQLLGEQGIVAVPESIHKGLTSSGHRMPDVLVDYQGLRLAIEGEFAASGAMKKAVSAAQRRVEEGLAHIGIALIYPADLKAMLDDIGQTMDALKKSTLRFAIITEAEADQLSLPLSGPAAPPETPFENGNLEALAGSLRRSYEYLVKDEVLQRAVEMLDHGVNMFVGSLSGQPATADRFMKALDIKALPAEGKKAKGTNK